MKSLSDNYSETHSSNHETFADLVFCAFVVLILFVLSLTIEVSNRVRGKIATTQEVKAEDVVKLTPKEMEELSKKLVSQSEELASQSQEIERLRREAEANNAKLQGQLASLSGEQRFTGAREPAAFCIAYNYTTKLYYFVPSKDIEDADRRRSGESTGEYIDRKRTSLIRIAVQCRDSRGFTVEEVDAIYRSVSQYKVVNWNGKTYEIENDEMHVFYHIMLCGYLASDFDVSDANENVIELAIAVATRNHGQPLDDMYPRCQLVVDPTSRTISWNGLRLSSRDLREILLSVSGRGLMLDLEGFEGAVPKWLYNEVLAPAGYIGKTPKPPSM